MEKLLGQNRASLQLKDFFLNSTDNNLVNSYAHENIFAVCYRHLLQVTSN